MLPPTVPFFDATPDPAADASPPHPTSWTHWLGLLAIPVAVLITLLGSQMDSGADDFMVTVGFLMGWLCTILSQSRHKMSKWIWVVLYPVVMIPGIGMLYFLTARHHQAMRLW